MTTNRRGWRGESHRHSLARRGIKTAVNNKPTVKIPNNPFYSETYKMSGKWYYIIRDKSQKDKMIYSSELDTKENIEKYSKRRTNLYNAQEDIDKNF